jgi:hypothetical protein
MNRSRQTVKPIQAPVEPEDLRDTIPDPERDTQPDLNPEQTTERDIGTGRGSVKELLCQSLGWYSPDGNVHIRKLISKESHSFRTKLFNLIKNDFLKSAFSQMQKEPKKYQKTMAAGFRQATMNYLKLLAGEEYRAVIDEKLLLRLTRLFTRGNWQDEEGISKMLEQARNILTSPYETD